MERDHEAREWVSKFAPYGSENKIWEVLRNRLPEFAGLPLGEWRKRVHESGLELVSQSLLDQRQRPRTQDPRDQWVVEQSNAVEAKLRSIAWRYNPQGVDDLIADTQLAALRAVRRGVKPGPGLLIRMLRCDALDGLRGKYRKGGQHEQLSGEEISGQLDHTSRFENQELIDMAMSKAGLSPQERKVFWHREVLEATGGEVAALLGVSEPRIAQVLSLSREKLRRWLTKNDSDR
ncbi:MAG: sigma-70 family RNA polymerase sigma factor [Planctomycetota bacterium]